MSPTTVVLQQKQHIFVKPWLLVLLLNSH